MTCCLSGAKTPTPRSSAEYSETRLRSCEASPSPALPRIACARGGGSSRRICRVAEGVWVTYAASHPLAEELERHPPSRARSWGQEFEQCLRTIESKLALIECEAGALLS